MTEQDLLQGIQQRSTLFAQGREIATNATKGSSTTRRAKAAGNLLLDLEHAHVPFGQIIVKRHRQVVQEQQDGILLLAQPVQQVLRNSLLATSFAFDSRLKSSG